MLAVAGQPFDVYLPPPSGILALGARVEVPISRAIVTAYAAAALVEGVWHVTLVAPAPPGLYLLVWRTPDPEPPEYETFVPLSVATAASALDGVSDPSVWTPTVDEVAAVVPAYTRGGFDDDAEQSGGEQATFTTATSPTALHVQGLIVLAVAEVAGRVGTAIPTRLDGLAQTCVIWHVAAAISAGKLPADTEDASGEYRSHISNYRASLDELAIQARQPWALRLA